MYGRRITAILLFTCLAKSLSMNEMKEQVTCIVGGGFQSEAKPHLCNGIIDCKDLTDECLCNSQEKNSSISNFCESICYTYIPSEACEVCEDRQLYCQVERKCLDFSRICDSVVDCQFSGIDESACIGTNGTIFPISNSSNCLDGFYDKNPFSSQEEMISSPVFVCLIWIQAVVAILGNIVVIHKRAKRWESYKRLPRFKRKSKRAGAVTRINMAILNFGVGVMLVIIGIHSVNISGEYCLQDAQWRISSACNAIGVIMMILIEASILNLAVITGYRIRGIFFPFKSMNLSMKISLMWAFFTWALALVLAILPLFATRNNIVTQAVISPSMYFESFAVTWSDYLTFAERLYTLVPRKSVPQYNFSSWDNVNGNLRQSYNNIAPTIVGYFGYYSTYGVCAPKLFSSEGSTHLPGYTLFLLSANFCCTVLASVMNGGILYRLGTRKIGETPSKFLQDCVSKRQLMFTTLAISYMSCWMAIFIMGMVSYSGSQISEIGDALGTLVLLPLPSALSPIIYTAGFRDVRKAIVSSIRPAEDEKYTSIEYFKKRFLPVNIRK